MSTWVGRFFFGDGWAVYAGPIGPTTSHAHHAFQLVCTLEGTVSLEGSDGAEVASSTAAIGPDVQHTIRRGAPSVLMVYEDPDTLRGRHLRTVVGGATRAEDWIIAGGPLETLRSVSLPASWQNARTVRNEAIDRLVPDDARPVPMHPAVVRARAWLAEHLEQDGLSLDRLGEAIGISGDRLSHVLNDELGLGLRPLILWLRMQRVVRELAEGRTISSAAAAAGFADGAHLTRTFRRMFGLAPSELAGLVEWVLPPASAT